MITAMKQLRRRLNMEKVKLTQRPTYAPCIVKEVVVRLLANVQYVVWIKVKGRPAIMGMTHQDLADYIGISRQSVTSTLNILRRDQKIDYDRHFIIMN